MRLTLLALITAGVAVGAYNIRGGTDDASLDQWARELHFTRRYPRRRKKDFTVFLFKGDGKKKTQDCTEELEDELDECAYTEIIDDEQDLEDVDWGDYLYFVDDGTDCDYALEEIEDDLGCDDGYRKYKKGGKTYKYRWYKKRWNGDKKSKKDDDDDDDHEHRHWWNKKWWNRHHHDHDEDVDDEQDHHGYPDKKYGYEYDDNDDEEDDTPKKGKERNEPKEPREHKEPKTPKPEVVYIDEEPEEDTDKKPKKPKKTSKKDEEEPVPEDVDMVTESTIPATASKGSKEDR